MMELPNGGPDGNVDLAFRYMAAITVYTMYYLCVWIAGELQIYVLYLHRPILFLHLPNLHLSEIRHSNCDW